jgi:8-oxo-dGTP pyrophosphatase MutT (NUDIX family)
MITSLATAGLLLIRHRKLLLAFSNNKQCFYLPGGKLDKNETAAAALCREAREELNIEIEEKELIYYTHVSAPAWGEEPGTIMEQECFFINKEVIPVASAEIGSVRYFSLQEYQQEKYQAPGVLQLLRQLTSDNFID